MVIIQLILALVLIGLVLVAAAGIFAWVWTFLVLCLCLVIQGLPLGLGIAIGSILWLQGHDNLGVIVVVISIILTIAWASSEPCKKLIDFLYTLSLLE